MNRKELDNAIASMLEELDDAAEPSWADDIYRRAHNVLSETQDALQRCRKGQE